MLLIQQKKNEINHDSIDHDYPKNMLMKQSVPIPEMYGVYSHITYWQSSGIYESKAMHSRILPACDNIPAR